MRPVGAAELLSHNLDDLARIADQFSKTTMLGNRAQGVTPTLERVLIALWSAAFGRLHAASSVTALTIPASISL